MQHETPGKIVGLVVPYGNSEWVKRVEVTVSIPASRTLLAHNAWTYEEEPATDVAVEAVLFCTEHGAQEIRLIDEPMPLSEATVGYCPDCQAPHVRVPWNIEDVEYTAMFKEEDEVRH